ncbi:MAG TPA: OPT/YSL family transporter [Pirellulaceae bacterium]|nr:OPT/YSL family transporter [Pirellulaceae bacterium]HMO90993.1 OPT/YSL family transporter [Pirellulaceae bacterium]HMP68108.1 OPT/YSL family transporter [Pirellulaceae bacterium]
MSQERQSGQAGSPRSNITIKHGPYPELTWVAIFVGWIIGAVITVSIAYAALILGFSIEGSELAAILGWGILRGVMRRTSIVENNINQTIASAVNGASSGIMFTVPALFILGRTQGFESVDEFTPTFIALLTFASITGCFLGLAFVIPLRKQMIDFDRLAYPGGIAVATILKSPGAGMRKATLLIGGALFAAILKFFILYYTGKDNDWNLGGQLGLPSMFNIVFYLSIMTIGVGFLSGKGGFWFGAGGFLCYFVIAPLLLLIGSENVQTLVHNPDALRVQLYRPTGIGMLIGAAIGGIIAAFPLILSALKSMQSAGKRFSAESGLQNDEMPLWLLYLAVGLGLVAMITLAYLSVDEMTLWRATLMALLGTLWIWVAGVIVSECVGRTNWSPLSGMTLIAVTIVILIAKAGMSSPSAVISAIVVGAAICLAISQASDMMLDLKSGYLTGAIPRRQQYAQYIGSWLGPLLVIILMIALNRYYEIGSKDLPAPQATALASVIEGIMSDNVPDYRYAAGAGLGLILALSGLGGVGVLIALGFYMPFNIVLTYTVGNVLRIVSDKFAGKQFSHDIGIPIAAGFIVGEALIGVGNAFYRIFFA